MFRRFSSVYSPYTRIMIKRRFILFSLTEQSAKQDSLSPFSSLLEPSGHAKALKGTVTYHCIHNNLHPIAPIRKARWRNDASSTSPSINGAPLSIPPRNTRRSPSADSAAILCTGWRDVIPNEGKHGRSAEQVPVSAYVGSSKNLNDPSPYSGGRRLPAELPGSARRVLPPLPHPDRVPRGYEPPPCHSSHTTMLQEANRSISEVNSPQICQLSSDSEQHYFP